VRNRACIIAPAIVLTAALSSARGQMLEANISQAPWWLQVFTQAPLTTPLPGKSEVRPVALAEYPASGILPAPPPAPVAVPPSGVLQPPPERRAVTTIPVKIAPPPRSAETLAASSANRHLRRIARGAESLKRERLARSIASARAPTMREIKKTRIFAVAGDRQAPVLHSRW
jgi:hypothetical protein